jgi:hypothetical protein
VKRSYYPGRIVVLVWSVATMVGLWSYFIGGRQATMASQKKRPASADQGPSVAVEPGTEKDAFDYYKETFDELNLNPGNLPGERLVASMDLGKALEFLGFKDLVPGNQRNFDDFKRNIENLSSADLMARYPGNILASAFFAPKITDVSVRPGDINVGWRKVVRLKSLDGSQAKRQGIAAAFFLFNKFQGKNQYDKDPFQPRADRSNESQTSQLILARGEGWRPDDKKRPVYFFVYGPLSDGGKLKTFLTASFDARAPDIVPGNKYFLPKACAECHGALVNRRVVYDKIKVNYLDTDHWFDRVQAGDDFAFIQNTPYGVLYDGGKDQTSRQFKDAFDVLRKINKEILEQNKMVEPDPNSPSYFLVKAAQKWVDLHENDASHKSYFDRALPTKGEPWRAGRDPDKELLPMLSQYCFRCHSSLRFSVFDRPEVVSRKLKILGEGETKGYLDLPPSSKFHMPQDRILDPATKERLRALLKAL